MPKIVTARQAVQAIQSHDDIVLANFCGEPRQLPMALMDRASELEGVRLFHMAVHGPFQSRYLDTGMEKHIRCATPFCGRSPIMRQLVREGRADYFPVTFSAIPRLLREGEFKSDAFMLTVSPPDSDGFCSLGVSVDYAWGAIERPPRLIIAEIDPHMPRTFGRTALHLSRIDYVVEVDEPLFELPQSPVTEIEKTIGGFVADLIDNGSTIQVGYGGVSESVLYFLKDKNNLGVHTEIVAEGFRELFNSGAITNSEKSIHRGKVVCTFHGGTKKLYDWIDNNHVFDMQPVDYTNNPKVIASNRKLVAVNTTLQVDLFGNIYSDVLGLDDQYTGVGGQLDFAVGCSLSDDARFINVLSSTTGSGKVSRIIGHPSREKGNAQASQILTVPRHYSDYVVTEYGIARLKGKSNHERANSLIGIAHPDFRESLRFEAKQLGLI